MRQYLIFYKRLGGDNFVKLEPIAHIGLYDRPEVNAAIEHIRLTPCVEAMTVRIEDELFNIVAFVQDAHAPFSFEFSA